jgi:hypothetical protein
MNQSPSPKTKTTKQPRSAEILLLMTILDTTWRAFVPTIGGTLLGVCLDNWLHKAPLFTAIMITLGFAISIALVMMQLRNVRRG